jgi:hypothetical protein
VKQMRDLAALQLSSLTLFAMRGNLGLGRYQLRRVTYIHLPLTGSVSVFCQIIFASGTGTTACLVARHIHNILQSDPTDSKTRGSISSSGPEVDEKLDVEVIALPCATTARELREQMERLARTIKGNPWPLPVILDSGTTWRPRMFARPSLSHAAIWATLQRQTCVNFDLIYTPRAFEILLDHCQLGIGWRQDGIEGIDECGLRDLFSNANIIYYHCGGIEGNESQLARYQRSSIGIS